MACDGPTVESIRLFQDRIMLNIPRFMIVHEIYLHHLITLALAAPMTRYFRLAINVLQGILLQSVDDLQLPPFEVHMQAIIHQHLTRRDVKEQHCEVVLCVGYGD